MTPARSREGCVRCTGGTCTGLPASVMEVPGALGLLLSSLLLLSCIPPINLSSSCSLRKKSLDGNTKHTTISTTTAITITNYNYVNYINNYINDCHN